MSQYPSTDAGDPPPSLSGASMSLSDNFTDSYTSTGLSNSTLSPFLTDTSSDTFMGADTTPGSELTELHKSNL